MPNFTAGTSFTDGVTNDVTAAKLNALVADAVPTSSLSLNSTTGTISLFSSGTGTAATPAIQPTGDTNTGIFFPAADTIAFSEGGAEAMRIDSSGNVGIGTNNPSTPSGKCITIYDSGIPRLNLKNSTSGDTATDGVELSLNGSDAYLNNRENGTVSIATNNATKLLVDSSGNVGIGTASPTRKLTISASGATFPSASNPCIRLDETSSGRFGVIEFDSSANLNIWGSDAGSGSIRFFNGTGSGTERLRIDSSGNLLVGTTTDAGHKICISHSHPASGSGGITINQIEAGTGRAIQFVFQTVNQVGSITTTNSATAYNTSSDYRLKTNLEPISNGIERVKQLSVYRFNWIADQSGNKVDGFVAHEAQAIIPECVTGEKDAVDADGKPIHQGIDQSKIVPLLTAALKEAIAKIETLEAKVTALEAA